MSVLLEKNGAPFDKGCSNQKKGHPGRRARMPRRGEKIHPEPAVEDGRRGCAKCAPDEAAGGRRTATGSRVSTAEPDGKSDQQSA
jgi:hypothetical protein